uniref:Uncharacterized protein n=1 Tax=Heterorhabditis bacteriophora TaxID=37862 RepID=A0A1I7WRT9_HETBA
MVTSSGNALVRRHENQLRPRIGFSAVSTFMDAFDLPRFQSGSTTTKTNRLYPAPALRQSSRKRRAPIHLEENTRKKKILTICLIKQML